eukprot:MONOS_15728.1-p1 / transcript=MONOS_15728.1 / gene=MONOS_15728 / organism=Monocercomonoides_exilis_PA203 / gene_product=unspecified product / transcript_product=unspecified product / location=Mono_scaffold01330:8228-9413(+) / protein_length=348 / sequence_SO=supercontig / SO=protein_coding / is_pseudo=false
MFSFNVNVQMVQFSEYKARQKMQAKDGTQKLMNFCDYFCSGSFSEVERSNEEEQKAKIEEMNGVIEEMSKEEFYSVFSEDMFNNINKMMKRKRINVENACLQLLKHIGHFKVLKCALIHDFAECTLNGRLETMISEEEEKKEEKDERLLVDACESYLLLNDRFNSYLVLICMPCLLKAALNKKENGETQKEVEMALLALSYIHERFEIPEELFFDEIKEIVEYHHEHHNLTHLAYVSAWKFAIRRLRFNENLYDAVANEQHFAKATGRELEELAKCVDWTGKKEKKEREEDFLLMRWLKRLGISLGNANCRMKSITGFGGGGGIVEIFRVGKEKYREIWMCSEEQKI